MHVIAKQCLCHLRNKLHQTSKNKQVQGCCVSKSTAINKQLQCCASTFQVFH